MLNDKPLAPPLHEFMIDAQIMLSQSQECLQHLELIDNDRDASECMVVTLNTLAKRAQACSLNAIAGFCQQINFLVNLAEPYGRLQGDGLKALNNCLTLLAWQLELIDPRTGQLGLDESEQVDLIGELACALGVDDLRLTGAARKTFAHTSTGA
ncbi:histidine kinase [Pseudomonas akapageensis]|uniref:histidine kinase n=1 Tax=Pseudomonas akapageensis TaxID=2609961 RepID=UPI0015B3DEC9|nr:histidine kinase [Pseudomonas akapageensis]